MAQINPLTGNPGSNNFVVNGDLFNGVDVSAAGRQVVNQLSELNAFIIAEDREVRDSFVSWVSVSITQQILNG